MADLDAISERLDRLSAELAELRRLVVLASGQAEQDDEAVWRDLLATVEEVSDQWQGPDAVAEIRAQRERQAGMALLDGQR
jgi:hypothetical protein